MSFLLQISRLIDAVSELIGKLAMWLILAATLISTGNALIRKIFGTSSNAWLEIQWYLFAAVFMLGGGYAFLRNAHVRIDFISSKFTDRTRNWIDIGGILVFLFPLCYMMVTLSWPLFINALESGEMSSNSGGLIRWPVYALIPLGFALLFVQGISELIKRFAFLNGQGPDVLSHSGPSETELLAQEIAEQEKARQAGASA
ncbi:MAG TPA: C4-dicarboxylate ABC transporter substrate-binding protein [Hydrogenophaga sp.]|jgi:TRAP-type mannitol/chloroaromatic compound transport system permease small subunit|uniref:TRAP transporter small permease subunit n=1 Tax=Hydrogenophaga sp. TaxID=1904254 RepID=UPI0008AC7E94|nr:TRAP transporter small permease subunit [Hydrogenophaga sp.]MBU4183773.1 TRAP transporter small permease subunit [Gammaproteobacteria bacterium]OGA78095.1 MAG: C4-dicarboxylate ABC transporter substrate-binding protein [Burkholderiales bacterium GWE1_65_30]OGA94446.1 MAG: C4-dicarboxylate ABC transporter substrate-binding protein [Burkholderiales bacterium GWF1_66_17]OGB21328.1 MAG: C4-dicarboxylate ABC transporter substrate-binding protein [Burkholderiales bacterium RIFCSPHIGHO2_02_FULL_66_